MIKEWRTVVGYIDYLISNYGEIKSIKFGKERLIKYQLVRGYFSVILFKNGKHKRIYVHQLVAQAFLGHVIDGYTMVVNHIDGNELNNRIDNLEIVTQRDNISTRARKDRDTMSSKYPNVHWNKRDKNWVSSISYKEKLYFLKSFNIEKEASELSEIALSHIENGNFEEYFEKLRDSKRINVLQYSKSGEFIREWNNATEAAKELNINRSDIYSCCSGKQKSTGGFKWSH